MIRVSDEGTLRIVTLDRPEKANSLTGAMLRDLAEIAEDSAACRAFVLTGMGKVFSAGADMEEARAGLATDPVWERLSGAIAALPGFTLAALNGTVAGGAFGMVLACDLRVSVPGANFFYPVMKLGFLPQPSDPVRLRALVGPARARLILMAGAKIAAAEAHAMGLVDVIDDDPVARARALSEDALAASPEHVSAIKSLI